MGGEGDQRGWDSCMASLTQWTWVWVNSGSWCWTMRPDLLQSMGVTKSRTWLRLNCTELNYCKCFSATELFPVSMVIARSRRLDMANIKVRFISTGAFLLWKFTKIYLSLKYYLKVHMDTKKVLIYLKYYHLIHYQSVSSVAQSCLTLCDPMNHSTPGLPVHHQLPEFNQTHVHRVGDAIPPSHPLSSLSPPAPNPF